jgi:hypothetical protein
LHSEVVDGRLTLFESSIWDSEKDAQEFCDGFTKLLRGSRPNGDYDVVQRKTRASFMVGTHDRNLRSAVLTLLTAKG